MKCEEPYEGNEYMGRERDLGHPGDHERFGKRWPRPLPSGELTDDVLDLIPSDWSTHERDFLIAFEVTNVYLIPVTAEDEDTALKLYSDYADLPDFHRETPIDGDLVIRRPSQYERASTTGAPIGPKIACPGCGREAMTRFWFHDPMRKCHGPITWTETRAPSPRYRWHRKHEAHAGWTGGAVG